MRQVKAALSDLIAKVDGDLEHMNNPRPARPENDRPTERHRLPDKQFTGCNSMLTDLLEVRHFRTIYNIFVVILLMLLLNTVVHDYVQDGSINVGLRPIRLGFRQFHLALFVWLQMQLMSTALYGWFVVWSTGRRRRWLVSTHVWDHSALGGFVVYEVVLLGWTVRNVFVYDLPMASSIAVLMELVGPID